MPGPNADRSINELVCLGVITGARGLKGDLRIKSFTQDPKAIAEYGELVDETGERRFNLTVTGEAKGVLIGRINGVTDRTGAEKLKGVRLHIARSRLPQPEEDEYYHSDLIGLRAETPEGDLGTVKQVFEFGAGDVLEISGGGHGTVMVPFTKAVVPVVDIDGGRLVIDPPDGLLEDPEGSPEDEK